jgi:anti-sigma factor RsiW
MTAEKCRQWREQIGALVLGQLSEDEDAVMRAHLDGCPACRAEVAALAPLGGLLALADPTRLDEQPAPPRDLGRRVARRIETERRERRRHRLRIALPVSAAAAAAATAAVIAVLVVGGGGGPAPVEVAFRSLPTGVEAGASLHSEPSGSRIQVQVHGVPEGTLCRVWVRRVDGKQVPAGSFRYREKATGEQTVLSSAVSPSRATAVGLEIGRRTFVGRVPHGAST